MIKHAWHQALPESTPPPAPLNELELGVLAIGEEARQHEGVQAQAIRDRLDLSATSYSQVLNVLIDDERAVEHSPVVVNRLLRIREDRFSRERDNSFGVSPGRVFAAMAAPPPTVEQRVAGGPHQRADDREAAAALPVEPVPAGQHLQAIAPARAPCWIQDPEGTGELPGVVVCWRHDPDSWRAQVTDITHDGTAPANVTAWLPPDRVRLIHKP